ncbi:MAG TPA: hypothetical protein VK422_08395 [Pyrinomonadaceae bacterium]|nr:hypothetical protein [Pyrinomonadaceae bacterium]
MASRLTVIFFIILCLEAGIVLTVAPWVQWFGMGDWGNNYFLLYASHKTGIVGLQRVVASGWVRGAVTGLGLLNLAMAFWEMFHFRQTVRRLQGADAPDAARLPEHHAPAHSPDATPTPDADHVSHHGGQGR